MDGVAHKAWWIGVALTAFFAWTPASADDWEGRERDGRHWHGSGWLGSPWGGTFRRDPIVGAYGFYNDVSDPYRSYRNDRGCYRVLPVETPSGVRRERVFVCDY